MSVSPRTFVCAGCRQEVTVLTWWHIDGQDYCRDCQATIPRRASVWDESVRGRIIGGDDTHRYKFFTMDGKTMIAEGDFANDSEAVVWFKGQFPGRHAEMRCYE